MKLNSHGNIRTFSLFFSPRKHEFFNPCNSEAMALRLAVADTVLGEAIHWLEGDGEVSDVDAKVKVWFESEQGGIDQRCDSYLSANLKL